MTTRLTPAQRAPRFLRLDIRFLAGTYSGTEWPPAPARLAQALVAGAESTTAPGLDWLEHQPAPMILATDEPPGVWRRDYVPLNATPGNVTRNARDRYIRREVEPVAYLWRLSGEGDDRQAEALIGTATRLTALGSGQHMAGALGAVVSAAPVSLGRQRLWLPGEVHLHTEVDQLLQVPAPGLMAELARRHAITRAGEQALRVQGHWSPQGGRSTADGQGLRTLAYRPSDARPRTAMLACALVRPDGEPAQWPAGEAAKVAGMLRHALIACAGSDADLAAFAAGHPDGDPGCRASVVPVPSTGHLHADGRIRRVLVTSRTEDAAVLGRLLSALPMAGLPLIDEHTGELVALARPIQDVRAEPVLRQWLKPSRCWASVQPVILPGLDSGEPRRTRKLLLRALAHAGLDAGLVEHLEFGRHGFLPQSVAHRDTRLKDRDSWRLPAVHVRLRFTHPVSGPLVLGQGRNAGVGTLVPCADLE